MSLTHLDLGFQSPYPRVKRLSFTILNRNESFPLGRKAFQCVADRSMVIKRIHPIRTTGIAGHALTLLPAESYDAAFVATGLAVGYAFDAQTGDHAIGSDRLLPFIRRPNSIAVVPKGCDVRYVSQEGGEYLLISPEHSRRGCDAETNLHGGACAHSANALRRMMLSEKPACSLDVEYHAETLLCSALGDNTDPAAARWMTTNRFQTLREHIENELTSTITVRQLADLIGVSSSFLSRAFKAYTGRSPHDYVLDRKVQRARKLMSECGLPLAAIANMAGFVSQAHMSSTFRRKLGVTPGYLREAMQ